MGPITQSDAAITGSQVIVWGEQPSGSCGLKPHPANVPFKKISGTYNSVAIFSR